MRVGIIGFGGWGRIHAQAVSELESHHLGAIACSTEKTAALARDTYPGVDVTLDYREILDRSEIDAVHVVVPSYLHAEVAIAALEAGKHAILEKPMAISVAEADQIVDAADRSDRVVTVVHELRVSKQWSCVRSLIDERAVGRPRYALLNLFRFPYRTGAADWRYDPARVGSWVLEEPIHFIDLLLWYFEENGFPVRVSAWTNQDTEGLSRDFSAIFEFENGAYGVVSQTLSAFEHHQVIEIGGTEGAIRSLWSGAMDRTDKPVFSLHVAGRADDAPRAVPLEVSGELFEIKVYLDAALNAFSEGRSLYTVRQERTLIRLCLAAEESARTRSPVRLEPER
jgi:myo-inositol 2-dehydrogenase/D-chiro-inositol 1-dehydrogenase